MPTNAVEAKIQREIVSDMRNVVGIFKRKKSISRLKGQVPGSSWLVCLPNREFFLRFRLIYIVFGAEG